MSDDLIAGGLLPTDAATSTDVDFDPDAIESDDLLDDAEDKLLDVDELDLGDDDDEFSGNE